MFIKKKQAEAHCGFANTLVSFITTEKKKKGKKKMNNRKPRYINANAIKIRVPKSTKYDSENDIFISLRDVQKAIATTPEVDISDMMSEYCRNCHYKKPNIFVRIWGKIKYPFVAFAVLRDVEKQVNADDQSKKYRG